MFSAIVAVDNDWGIGYQGQLLEKISADLKRFKELTSGDNNAVIMGRKTWDSLPKKPLPNRKNLIVTRHPDPTIDSQIIQGDINMIIYSILNNHILGDKDYFVIGGGQIYKELLPFCEYVYVTKIFNNHDNIDTYFPNLDEDIHWQLVNESAIQQENNLKFQFCLYKRI